MSYRWMKRCPSGSMMAYLCKSRRRYASASQRWLVADAVDEPVLEGVAVLLGVAVRVALEKSEGSDPTRSPREYTNNVRLPPAASQLGAVLRRPAFIMFEGMSCVTLASRKQGAEGSAESRLAEKE